MHSCTFLTIIPGRLNEYTWEHPDHSAKSSIVKWEIEQQANKTLVTLTHSGNENFTDTATDFSKQNYQMGWNAIVKTSLCNNLFRIERLVFEIDIKTTPSLLWQKLWHSGNYTRWTESFCEGSFIDGKLALGERVHFLTPSGDGMYSDITFFKENELVVFSHIGNVENKKEIPPDYKTERWTGSFESYRLLPKGDTATLKVEVDTVENYINHMKTNFPLALQHLKEMAETD